MALRRLPPSAPACARAHAATTLHPWPTRVRTRQRRLRVQGVFLKGSYSFSAQPWVPDVPILTGLPRHSSPMPAYSLSTATIVKSAALVAVVYATSRLLKRRQRKRTILVTGGSGYLGQHLLSFLAAEAKYSLHATYSGNANFVSDWANVCTCHKVGLEDGGEEMAGLLAMLQPDVVVHLAAISSPAKAEADPARAQAVNCPVRMLHACPQAASFVFLSTDQVSSARAAATSHRLLVMLAPAPAAAPAMPANEPTLARFTPSWAPAGVRRRRRTLFGA